MVGRELIAMKPLLAFCLVLGTIGWVDAIFDRRGGNTFPVGNIVNCGETIAVGLDPRTLDTGAIPVPSGFVLPSGDLTLAIQLDLLRILGADFNQTFQSVTEMTGSSPTVCTDETALEQNDEGLRPSDVPEFFQDRYFEEGFNDTAVYSIHSGDTRMSIRRTLNTLNCRVTYNWADAGENFFPRYYSAGSCFERRCSIPDRVDFLCRPDVFNQDQMGTLTALRWDCCWEVVESVVRGRRGRTFRRYSLRYNCGWRRIRFPIVCDCDCNCPGNRPRI